MEPKRPDPQLSLQPFDPEVFQRVWNRVMPNQEHSPIAVNRAQNSAPAIPAFSPAPEESPKAPLTCLGEDSQPYLQTVEDMMEQTQGFLHTLQRLSRRSQGRTARVLYGLTSELRRELRQLSTAYFLIAGERHSPSQTGPSLSGPFDLALRTLFQQFHQRAAQARSAAQGMTDPCLQQLFQDLGDEAEFFADRIRNLLEGM